jgi:nitroreductase
MNVWKTLLQTAIHAPSPHNVQPWRVQILSDDRADLLIEKRRTLPKEDPTGSFIILTMGLFIEALSILAANRSLSLHHELHQAPSQFTPEHIAKAAGELLPFARLSLSQDEEAGEARADAKNSLGDEYDDSLFLTRRTSRISLSPERVPDEAAQALARLASAWGQKYEQVSAPETVERILERNIDALFADLNAPAYHDEIVEWFRFTDRASRRTRDGLDYRCMNSSRLSFWLAARFPKLLQLPLARPLLHRIYRRQLGIVPTIGMLAGPFWDAADAFQTGRFLMHFWLELARRDLYLHPYGNLVTNKPAAEWCRKALGVSDIWLIFKIGFSKVPPQSYRRSVEEVLVD